MKNVIAYIRIAELKSGQMLLFDEITALEFSLNLFR